ncbi:heavy metal-binding domain-containing protein [Anaerobacillus sp. HL2]|nr:heavy metal-binding domain-containing protein [Anaerobacillus sp. HL2]
MAGLKSIVGGEIKEYAGYDGKVRENCYAGEWSKKQKDWVQMIVSVRLQTSSVMNGVGEIVAYGTAVIAK